MSRLNYSIFQDMLENESIELDWSFRYSLISDIIKVILYEPPHVISNNVAF